MNKAATSKQLFYCIDDPILSTLSIQGTSYGFHKNAQFRCANFRQEGFRIFFDVHVGGKAVTDIEVPLTGKHNALNATAVFAHALSSVLPVGSIKKALLAFQV